MAVDSYQGLGSSYCLFHSWFLIIDLILCNNAVLAVECDQTTALQKLQTEEFDCEVLTGRIMFTEQSKVFMQNIFEKVNDISGNLHYFKTEDTELQIANLNFITEQDGPFILIESNHKLQNIRSLLTMNFKEKDDENEAYVKFLDNPLICDTLPMRHQLMDKVQVVNIYFDNHCLTSCDGGIVDEQYIENFPEYCSEINGDLTITGREGSDGLAKLAQVTNIHGSLIITNNANIPNLEFFTFLRHIGLRSSKEPALVLTNNTMLSELRLKRLETLEGAEDVEYLVVVKYLDGQDISDLDSLMDMSGNRIQISLLNNDAVDEDHADNTWLVAPSVDVAGTIAYRRSPCCSCVWHFSSAHKVQIDANTMGGKKCGERPTDPIERNAAVCLVVSPSPKKGFVVRCVDPCV
ncbi:hypothetical protein Aduo_017018 [Ancylostoma duodenale]